MDNSVKKSVDHSGHRQRVKDAVKDNGFGHLADKRLLELLLFYSIPRADTNKLAHTLINEFGSLKGVFEADINTLKKVEGMGESSAIMIADAGAIFKRISTSVPEKRRAYKTCEALKELALLTFNASTTESVVMFCFDGNYRLEKQVVLGEGDSCSSELDLRKAVQTVMDCGASSAVLAHNHPYSAPEPSAYDVDSTRVVSVMLRKLGFPLTDHIIVSGEGEVYSMYSDPRFRGMFY